MSERRQNFRRRTLLEGRLEVAKLNGWTLDCSVRNLSTGGAKVTIPGGVVVPHQVGLAVSGKPQRPARLVWYRDGQAGFALDETRDEDTSFADAVEPLRSPQDSAPQDSVSKDRFAARVAAITEGRPQGHFTRP